MPAAASYVAFYRKAHDVVSAALAAQEPPVDARRLRWVFGPNSTSSAGCGTAAAYYPGAGYVDYLGMSAYRSGTQSVASAVVDPAHALTAALGYSGELAKDRFIVLQTGSRDEVDDDRGVWLGKLYGALAEDPLFLGAIYFNAADWAVLDGTTPPTPLEGYAGWVDAMKALPVAGRPGPPSHARARITPSTGIDTTTSAAIIANTLVSPAVAQPRQPVSAATAVAATQKVPGRSARFAATQPITRPAATPPTVQAIKHVEEHDPPMQQYPELRKRTGASMGAVPATSPRPTAAPKT